MKKSFARVLLFGLLSTVGAFLPWTAQAADGSNSEVVCNKESAGDALTVLYCAQKEMEVARNRREQRWKQMETPWTAAQRESFQRLTKLAGQWFDNAAKYEYKPDAAPNWNIVWRLDNMTSRWQKFSRLLDLLVKNKMVPFNGNDPQELAYDLNLTMQDVYRLFKAGIYPEGGKLESSEVQESQALWQKYRQAWLEFYHVMYPKQADTLLATCLVQSRINEWSSFVMDHRFPDCHDASAQRGQNPSFSCVKASSLAEQTICANPSLADMDRMLHEDYQMAKADILPCDPKLHQLIEAQRVWLQKRVDCGANVVCLKRSYQQRIDQLEK